ncbi:DUF72 domain-containing protein [Vulcanisaeta souniana]|uniref:DUF72 domain-containing protein n=1 Tax=Vulcanisaeta souniana JCM 11219 TaxID=1293586 RepID=A0A830E086_9CREN|nr:DUF72 domain-containing protein [Vulcanisaeta souniana]BDR91554.1 hypothetical protein Vsou_06470 [Vulcanisaeta souniana JCM 11219]GGI74080.1 hypothetical protein GCM10007112_08630 [Vulcanisaeta souniana JCM 11219]
MVKVFVGTSGWLYDWNQDSTFDWYVRNSGLNAVELNVSFYRFPFRNQVASWARKGAGLRWAVKVHRYVTHVKRLREDALDTWRRFRDLFQPLDPYIDFYLFQMPPSFAYNDENIERISVFAKGSGLSVRLAIEFRHESWFNSEDAIDELRHLGITVVSIDEPGITWIESTNGIVYLRLHGKTDWYMHDYGEDELRDLAVRAFSLKPNAVYVFFNNDHWMLENARKMLTILRDLVE